ncbi:LrgB-like family-domain-containing protein [Gaertneriomyces semiglobifer]|nr:LrgB-like family-domain-containing protein [Gaertneriomyces semiglobifer]
MFYRRKLGSRLPLRSQDNVNTSDSWWGRFEKALKISPWTIFADWVAVPVFVLVMLTYIWGVDRAVQGKFPASVLAMLLLFFALALVATLVPRGEHYVDKVLTLCGAGIEWLLKWMPLMFSPVLIVLPAEPILPGTEIGKVIAIFVAGYVIFLSIIVGCAQLLQYFVREYTNWRRTSPVPVASQHMSLHAGDQSLAGSASALQLTEEMQRSQSSLMTDSPAMPAAKIPEEPVITDTTPNQHSTLSSFLGVPIHPSTVAIYVLGLVPAAALAFAANVLQPLHLIITTLAYMIGLAVPRAVRSILHPLFTCALIAVLSIWAVAAIRGETLNDELFAYYRRAKFTVILNAAVDRKPIPTPGAGDVLYSLLDAAVATLGVRMYTSRGVLKSHAITIITTVITMAPASIFFHAALASALDMDPTNALAVTIRFVTTPLALQIFSSTLTEANVSLGVILVLVSGVIGDISGPWLLQRLFRVKKDDVVTIGLAVGITSHAVGTAGLLHKNAPASAISALAFVLFATISVVVTSIPVVVDSIKSLAGLAD